jgi:hypothetical protein
MTASMNSSVTRTELLRSGTGSNGCRYRRDPCQSTSRADRGLAFPDRLAQDEVSMRGWSTSRMTIFGGPAGLAVGPGPNRASAAPGSLIIRVPPRCSRRTTPTMSGPHHVSARTPTPIWPSNGSSVWLPTHGRSRQLARGPFPRSNPRALEAPDDGLHQAHVNNGPTEAVNNLIKRSAPPLGL